MYFFIERPTRTRIRKVSDKDSEKYNNEPICEVKVTITNGSFDRTPAELSRLATELLANHLNQTL